MSGHFDEPFPIQHVRMLRQALDRAPEIRLEALLVLEGLDDLGLFPRLADARAAWQRDTHTGDLPTDADADALHVLSASVYFGYVLFRDAFSHEMDIDVTELDERVLTSYADLLGRLSERDEHIQDAQNHD